MNQLVYSFLFSLAVQTSVKAQVLSFGQEQNQAHEYVQEKKGLKDTLLLGGALNQYVDYSPPYLYWYPALDSVKAIQNALKYYTSGNFFKWEKRKAFTMGITGKAYWLALKVKDTSASLQTYLWSFYTTSCKYEFYDFDTSGRLISQFLTSTYSSLKKRPYPVRSISFPFEIKGGETRLLFVKVQSTNTDVLYADQDFSTPEDFLLWEIGYTVLLNRYFGFFIFALLANALLFFYMRNRIYGWLSIYIFFLLLYNLNDFCFDVLIFPSWLFEKFVLIPKFTWIIGATFSSLIVFNRFTDQKKHFPDWYKYSNIFIRVLQFLMPLILIAHLFILDHQNKGIVYLRFAAYTILIAAILFQFLNLFYLSFKKHPAGLFFLLSSGPLIISAFFYFYYMITDINLYILLPGNVINACCFEVILLTIIFIYDYRNKNIERNKLLEESVLAGRRMTVAVLETQEQERKRIAEDLHDELGSSLAALKLRVQKSELPEPEMKNILDVVDKASADTRSISHNLMPPEFGETSLRHLLSAYYHRLNNETGTHFSFLTSGDTGFFSKDDELVIYRILMEITQNILKHSKASESTIQLIYYDDKLEIMCEDNGIGFTPGSTDGIGLKNIRSRVNYLNGNLRVDSNYGGTTIMITIPFGKKTKSL